MTDRRTSFTAAQINDVLADAETPDQALAAWGLAGAHDAVRRTEPAYAAAFETLLGQAIGRRRRAGNAQARRAADRELGEINRREERERRGQMGLPFDPDELPHHPSDALVRMLTQKHYVVDGRERSVEAILKRADWRRSVIETLQKRHTALERAAVECGNDLAVWKELHHRRLVEEESAEDGAGDSAEARP